jgi:hypothetical protein
VRKEAISPVTTTSASIPDAAAVTRSRVAEPVGRRIRIVNENIPPERFIPVLKPLPQDQQIP